MARNAHIRGTRSRAPYGYARDGKPYERPTVNVLAWILVILFLTAMAIFSWIFPAYVFRNPHIPLNYDLLQKIGRLEPLKAFSPSAPPESDRRIRPKFHTARELFQDESGRPEDQRAIMNDFQKRLFIQNYEDGEMLGYITGPFSVLESRVLGDGDLFPGIAVRAISQEYPNVVLEFLMPIAGEITNPYQPGDTLDLKPGGDLAAILHLTLLPEARLSVTAMSLRYTDRSYSKEVGLDIEVPKAVNLRAQWPVFSGPVVLPGSQP